MTREDFMYWLRGALRSWTVWFGVLLAALPELLSVVEPDLRPIVGDKGWEWLSLFAKVTGACIVLLRMRTTTSLPLKGGKPDGDFS